MELELTTSPVLTRDVRPRNYKGKQTPTSEPQRL